MSAGVSERPARTPRRRRLDWPAALVLAVIVGVPLLLTWRTVHRERLRPGLIEAARSGDARRVARILDRGADPNARDRPQEHPTFFDSMKMALGLKKRPDDSQYPSALMLAAAGGKTDVVRVLLRRGAKPNARGPAGKVALHYAVDESHPDCVAVLLAGGANPNARDGVLRTPLLAAFGGEYGEGFRGSSEMASTLLAHGADPRLADKDGALPFARAIQAGLPELFAPMLRNGADANTSTQWHSSALGWSIEHKRADLVKLLLDYKADPNRGSSTDFGEAQALPLAGAVGAGDPAIMRLLLERGADPNRDTGSRPVLHMAVADGKAELAALLLDHGADRRARYEGRDALMWAVVWRDPAMVRLLLEHSADANARDADGDTPLQVAAFNGDADIVRLLVSHGARPADRDPDGRTASDLAAGHPGVLAALKGASKPRGQGRKRAGDWGTTRRNTAAGHRRTGDAAWQTTWARTRPTAGAGTATRRGTRGQGARAAGT